MSDTPPPQPGLRDQAVEGTLWSGIAQIGVQVSGVLSTAVLARLLYPKEFGLLGMALIFIGLGQQINELGLSAALVQRKDLHPEHTSTSFWATLGMSAILALMLALGAPLAAVYFKEPRVTSVFRLISIDFVFTSLSVVPRALLQRDMRFRGIAFSQLAAGAAYGVAAIVAALLKCGVYSLIIGQFAFSLAANIVVWRVARWKPRFRFSMQRFRELARFSLNMLGANILNYSGANVDNFLVGRMLGSAPLGVYSMAYNLATVPQRKIARLLIQVLFPAFARIQEEKERLRDAFLRSQTLLAIVVFPMLMGLIAVSRDFVLVLLGGKWLDAITPIQILAGAGIAYAMVASVSSLILSRGRTDLLLWFGLARLATISVFVVIGMRYGVNGVAWAILTYALLFWFIFQHIVNRLAGLTMWGYFGALFPGFIPSVVMVAAILAANRIPGASDLPAVVRLAADVVAGAAVYAAALFLLFRPAWNESRAMGISFLARLRNPFGRAPAAARNA